MIYPRELYIATWRNMHENGGGWILWADTGGQLDVAVSSQDQESYTTQNKTEQENESNHPCLNGWCAQKFLKRRRKVWWYQPSCGQSRPFLMHGYMQGRTRRSARVRSQTLFDFFRRHVFRKSSAGLNAGCGSAVSTEDAGKTTLKKKHRLWCMSHPQVSSSRESPSKY